MKWVSIVQEHAQENRSWTDQLLLLSLIRFIICGTSTDWLMTESVEICITSSDGLFLITERSRYHSDPTPRNRREIFCHWKATRLFFFFYNGTLKPPVHLRALSHDPIDSLEYSLEPQSHPLFPGFIPLQGLKALSRFILRALWFPRGNCLCVPAKPRLLGIIHKVSEDTSKLKSSESLCPPAFVDILRWSLQDISKWTARPITARYHQASLLNFIIKIYYGTSKSINEILCFFPVSLCRVLAKSRQNLMSSQGISIVFGPTLMWPELDAGNMAVNMLYQNQIVELMLIECTEIFGPESK